MSARETIALSAVSVEEVEFGLVARPKESVRRVFEEILRECCVVYPVTLEIARAAGELRGSLRRRGMTRSQADMLIAATVLVHGCVVATRNVRDFEECGVEVFNPWGV